MKTFFLGILRIKLIWNITYIEGIFFLALPYYDLYFIRKTYRKVLRIYRSLYIIINLKKD